ncbi:helix-turn-helix domain-containing protein [Micromonospora sp. NPDC049559]|uniref:helix-turn-helix domain-containing protein n=1 Tax=Micromonospora sp. NPDC049559 TaxID=3155923 RepID=UPI0034294918
MYREAGSRVAGAVLWRSWTGVGAAATRILPDGCIDLIWSNRDGLFVAGPDRTAKLDEALPGVRHVGLRLPPGTGPAVLGLPAYELRDRQVPLDALWPSALAREYAERALDGDPGPLLESIAQDRLRAAGGPDPIAGALVAHLDAGRPVAATAAALGLGARALHRRSHHLFGYGAKTLARILRMQRALALVRAGVPAAEAAARAGYADQPHLSRDVRELAGVPLGVLVRQ